MPSGMSIATMIRRLEKIENRKPKEENFPVHDITLRGANLEIQKDESREVLLVGAAGTGKTTACLKKIYDICLQNQQVRVALVRKTRASLVETALVTFEQHILGYGHPLLSGSNRQNRTSYVFPNNSRINIVGMDKPERVLSADYDIIYICQAEELTEGDAEALKSRLRNNKLPFQQLMMDCNPQAESHWLYQKYKSGQMKMMNSFHKDNPAFYDIDKNDWTELGKQYVLGTLANLTGVFYKRWYLGQWCSAEGAVYEFERDRHTTDVLPAMRRYIAGVDWGHRDAGAFVLVGEGVDGILYVVEEILRTGQTLDFWKLQAQRWMTKYGAMQFMCDPSLQAHIQAFVMDGIPALKGMNKIQMGVDLIQQRLATDSLKIYNGSVLTVDHALKSSHQPTSLMEEVEGYVWNDKRDAPKDGANHALDALRYAVVQYDRPLAQTMPQTSWSRQVAPINRFPSKVARRYRSTNR